MLIRMPRVLSLTSATLSVVVSHYPSLDGSSVQLADKTILYTRRQGQSTSSTGCLSRRITCSVVDLHGAHDLILGDSWLTATRAIINYGAGTLTVHKGQRRFTVKSPRGPSPSASVPATSSKPLLCYAAETGSP
jgi:hypothetical protein